MAKATETKAKKSEGRMTRETQVGLRTYTPLVELIQELADRDKRSLSQMVEILLLQATAAECKKAGVSIKKIEGLL